MDHGFVQVTINAGYLNTLRIVLHSVIGKVQLGDPIFIKQEAIVCISRYGIVLDDNLPTSYEAHPITLSVQNPAIHHTQVDALRSNLLQNGYSPATWVRNQHIVQDNIAQLHSVKLAPGVKIHTEPSRGVDTDIAKGHSLHVLLVMLVDP